MNWTTSSRLRVTTARPVRQFVCFQPMPLSCSCRQTTLGLTETVPSGVVLVPLKYWGRGSVECMLGNGVEDLL